MTTKDREEVIYNNFLAYGVVEKLKAENKELKKQVLACGRIIRAKGAHITQLLSIVEAGKE